MALASAYTAVAIKAQAGAGAFTQPSSSADTYPCANARPKFDPITAQSPEYLGTIHRPGDIVLGSRASLTFQIVLRGPGGSVPPAAGAFIPGRLLVAAGFTENILSATVPTGGAEAIGGSPAATTSSLALGASAVGTADLYKGLALNLSDNGSGYLKQLTAIQNYTSGKVASLFETLGAEPAANYVIPKQLAYQLSAAAPSTYLSVSVWLGGVRYDFADMVPTSVRFNVPTSSRDSQDFPVIEFTLEGSYQAFEDEVPPTVTALGAIPPYRNGDFWLANKALGMSSFSCDLGIQAAYPPNPNFASGYEGGQIVETRRSAQVTLNHNLKSTIDFWDKFDQQTNVPLWAQWGYGAGSSIMFNIPRARIVPPDPDNSGQLVTQQINMLIDDASRAVNLIFPY